MLYLIATCSVQSGYNPNNFPGQAYLGYSLGILVPIEEVSGGSETVNIVNSLS
jgi:hypothetical protein